MTVARPIRFLWTDGLVMAPVKGYLARAEAQFEVGKVYQLEVREERSAAEHNHYFAARSVGKNGKRSIAVAAVAAARRPPGYVSMEAPRVTPPPVTIPSGPPVK